MKAEGFAPWFATVTPMEEIDTLWRTAPLRSQKPSPTDEVRTVMGVFDETLFTAVHVRHRRE
ncbi:phosphoenolpyruvate carboxylase, partial [Microbacterium sp. BF1]|uniref:phosphoenolpyruvate carboxylase n=1 Tax=Microbacterium sp. BF1 TaxID=2821146 RepID=UPI0027E39342